MDRPLPARQATLGRLPAGRGLVRREALFERLSTGSAAVTVVCAPAGSGKSVLLRSWVEAERPGRRVAWVSVERGERDPQRFWLSVVEALARKRSR
jgi:LuxR family transcriptional regulator, maltose regulon positive regulatory protein